MEEFVKDYGLWILLGVVFIAMHRFGTGCGQGHDHGAEQADDPPRADEPSDGEKTTPAGRATGRQ